MALLEVKDLSISFEIQKKKTPVVQDVSFELEKGKTLGIVGESGCGKSVTLKAIMGLVQDEGGIVEAKILNFNGNSLLNHTEKEWRQIRGLKMSMIFQDPMSSLNPLMKVGKQVVEVLVNHKLADKVRAKQITLDLFNEVGIPFPEKRFEQYPHELSGGLLQRVVIAMALAPKPDLILADEPTTALDVTIQKQILNLLKKIREERDMAMIFITHDLGVLKEIADDIYVFYAGREVEFIKSNELFEKAKHPYTQGLIKSLPQPFTKAELYSIPGRVKSPTERTGGCGFAERCDKATEECSKMPPPWKSWGENHSGACYNA